jgi:hypothetical protein
MAAAQQKEACRVSNSRRTAMNLASRWFSSLLLGAALISPLLTVGCAGNVRVYDPYYHDYHRWDDHETVYYSQWETENHRDHRDFRKRNKDEQKQYWDWRHSHGDH